MSNLAASRDFRRVGIAEELIQNAENLVRTEWGFSECYLRVENYRKLGYKCIKLTDFGSLLDSETVLL